MDDEPVGRDNEESTEEPQDSPGAKAKLPEGSQLPLEDENLADMLLDNAVREATKVASDEHVVPRWDFAAGRRRDSIFQGYFRSIEEHLRFLPIWPPDRTFEPGDVGMLADGDFIRVSHISAMGLPDAPRTISYGMPDVNSVHYAKCNHASDSGGSRCGRR